MLQLEPFAERLLVGHEAQEDLQRGRVEVIDPSQVDRDVVALLDDGQHIADLLIGWQPFPRTDYLNLCCYQVAPLFTDKSADHADSLVVRRLGHQS